MKFSFPIVTLDDGNPMHRGILPTILALIFDSLEIPLKQDLSNFSKRKEMKRSELRYRRVFIENARPSFPDPRKPSITLLGAREGETPPVPGRATERGRSAR